MSTEPALAPAQRGQWRAIALFVALLLTLLSACWSLVGSLLAPVLPGGWWTVLGAALLLTANPLATLLAARALGAYAGAPVRLLVFRPFWYALFLLLLLTLAGAGGALLGAAFGRAAEAGRLAMLAATAMFAAVATAGYVGNRRLEIRRCVAALPGLPAALDGLTIAQISDLHVGPQTSRLFLERVARAVREASPELIAVTGDLVDDFPGDVDRYAEVLGRLAAPLGVYVVPGNHEVYTGWDAVRERLDRLPLRVLLNEAVTVSRNGGRLSVAGTGDPAFGPGSRGAAAPDIERALAGVPPGTFVLALAHNPALWPALAARGVNLTLSGHTHWGQVAFPGLGWCLASPFLRLAMGVHVRGDSLLYIHPGTGYWGLPLRIGHAAQVALIELRRGERAALSDAAATR